MFRPVQDLSVWERSGALDGSRKMLFAAQEEQARVKRTSDQLCGAFQGMGIK